MKNKKGLTFYEPKKKVNTSLLSEVVVCLVLAAIAAFMAVVITYFLGISIRVVGSSMEPGLKNGQDVLVNRFAYVLSTPKVGDIVVFLPHGNEKSHYYVKRVVAGPGSRVVIRDGVLYVDGEKSPYGGEGIENPGIAGSELTLGKGEFFCLGDNPQDGEDSRHANIGPVQEKDMIGKVWYVSKSEDET